MNEQIFFFTNYTYTKKIKIQEKRFFFIFLLSVSRIKQKENVQIFKSSKYCKTYKYERELLMIGKHWVM